MITRLHTTSSSANSRRRLPVLRLGVLCGCWGGLLGRVAWAACLADGGGGAAKVGIWRSLEHRAMDARGVAHAAVFKHPISAHIRICDLWGMRSRRRALRMVWEYCECWEYCSGEGGGREARSTAPRR